MRQRRNVFPEPARKRLLQELEKLPMWTSVDRTKEIHEKTGLSVNFVNAITRRNARISYATAKMLVLLYGLDWGAIIAAQPVVAPESISNPEGKPGEPSVRDWFAMSALNAMLAGTFVTTDQAITKEHALAAYCYADAMMEARQA